MAPSVLYDYAEHGDDPTAAKAARGLVVVRNNQRLINEVVEGYPPASRPEMASGHPAGLPELFLGRSLGHVQVPKLLRAAGLHVRTLAEEYGIPQDEDIVDTEWLAHAGRSDWPVLMRMSASGIDPQSAQR